jgi:hypothetical protein
MTEVEQVNALARRVSGVLQDADLATCIAALVALLGSALRRAPIEERHARLADVVAALEHEMNNPSGDVETVRKQ